MTDFGDLCLPFCWPTSRLGGFVHNVFCSSINGLGFGIRQDTAVGMESCMEGQAVAFVEEDNPTTVNTLTSYLP